MKILLGARGRKEGRHRPEDEVGGDRDGDAEHDRAAHADSADRPCRQRSSQRRGQRIGGKDGGHRLLPNQPPGV